jgi:hypothetical protein
MREELDKLLCERYPKMMVNRHKPMQETCMCWGFECGDGWFNILNTLMFNIQHHIDWKNETRARDIAHNQSIIDARRHPADWTKFNELHPKDNAETDELREGIIDGTVELRTIEPEVQQVTLDQVKEKFGTLRFYYTGGDDHISGMVCLAEGMSVTTCEDCGSPAERRNGGWIRTLCDKHEAVRQLQMKGRYEND